MCLSVSVSLLQPAFVWEWYCSGKEAGESVPVFMRAFITGWLPNLLLNLWLVMALPRLVYLVVQVRGRGDGRHTMNGLEQALHRIAVSRCVPVHGANACKKRWEEQEH